MKHKKLHVLVVFVLLISACQAPGKKDTQNIVDVPDVKTIPGIKAILKQIDRSQSGYVYIYNSTTINNEIDYHGKVLDTLRSDSELHGLLKVHRERTKKIKRILENRMALFFKQQPGGLSSTAQSLVYAKPPNPCPGQPVDTSLIGSSSCLYGADILSFFTESAQDSVNINKNGKSIEPVEDTYNELTKMRTIKLSEKITYDSGEFINMKYTVTYMDTTTGRITTRELQYKEPIRW